MSESGIDYGWLSPEQFGDLSVIMSSKADVVSLQSDRGGRILVSGLALRDYVRYRIAAEHCPRCGDFLRGALLTMNLQCEDCDIFDRERDGRRKV